MVYNPVFDTLKLQEEKECWNTNVFFSSLTKKMLYGQFMLKKFFSATTSTPILHQFNKHCKYAIQHHTTFFYDDLVIKNGLMRFVGFFGFANCRKPATAKSTKHTKKIDPWNYIFTFGCSLNNIFFKIIRTVKLGLNIIDWPRKARKTRKKPPNDDEWSNNWYNWKLNEIMENTLSCHYALFAYFALFAVKIIL